MNQRFAPMAQRRSQSPRRETPDLSFSPREMQTLYLVACGRTRKQIAAMLEISVHTVDIYLRQLFEKIGIRNVVHLQRHAVLSGWLKLDGL